MSKRRELIKLLRTNDQVYEFVRQSIENQIEGNVGTNDTETAKSCGLTIPQLDLLWQLI